MNHTNRILSLTLAGLMSATASAAAVAQSTAPDFKALDSNSDGKISKEEYKAHGGQDDAFRKSDADGDNALSVEELMSADPAGSTSGAAGQP